MACLSDASNPTPEESKNLMKNQKQTSILTRSCLALAMTLAICSPVPGRSEAAAGGGRK
jgi:hypothetical protein